MPGVLLLALLAFYLGDLATEPLAHWQPRYDALDLSTLLERNDVDALLRQTGLTEIGLERVGRDANALLPYQKALFADVGVRCTRNSIFSKQEALVGLAASLVPLEDGDVLVSPCSHVSGWRNGHAAIVVDAANGLTLESYVLGEKSAEQDVFAWREFPAFLVFRLKGADAAKRAEIAAYARRTLENVPYGFTNGIFTPKHRDGVAPVDTQCAHLVWDAFFQFDFDLDSDGGAIVTPRDLAGSPLLELVQAYGMDPTKLWS